ncbi:MAG TPA: suppressor of fused domain protein [Solirubrobacteraceae bacterium]|nr:suppressor of fused domain protein [Solirubrobacteraceae bacterium]
MTGRDDEAPGWDAIDAALARLYPGQDDPAHWATLPGTRARLGGPEALDGVSAFAASEPAPHWHWVTYGMTELYAKESEDPEWSGWGYELTMRAPRGDEAIPDTWPLMLLKGLANMASRDRRVFRAGDWFDAGSSITGRPSALTGLAMLADPQLPPLDTPHGRVDFVEVIGLHAREVAYCATRGLDELLRDAGRSYTGEFNVLDREPFVD